MLACDLTIWPYGCSVWHYLGFVSSIVAPTSPMLQRGPLARPSANRVGRFVCWYWVCVSCSIYLLQPASQAIYLSSASVVEAGTVVKANRVSICCPLYYVSWFRNARFGWQARRWYCKSVVTAALYGCSVCSDRAFVSHAVVPHSSPPSIHIIHTATTTTSPHSNACSFLPVFILFG